MGRVRVKYNHLPAVIRALPDELADGIDLAARDLSNDIEPILWIDTGVVRSTVEPTDYGLQATVGVGHAEGLGFYVRFLELGTDNPNAFGITFTADPRVTQAAEAYRPQFTRIMADAVQRAARAR